MIWKHPFLFFLDFSKRMGMLKVWLTHVVFVQKLYAQRIEMNTSVLEG